MFEFSKLFMKFFLFAFIFTTAVAMEPESCTKNKISIQVMTLKIPLEETNKRHEEDPERRHIHDLLVYISFIEGFISGGIGFREFRVESSSNELISELLVFKAFNESFHNKSCTDKISELYMMFQFFKEIYTNPDLQNLYEESSIRHVLKQSKSKDEIIEFLNSLFLVELPYTNLDQNLRVDFKNRVQCLFKKQIERFMDFINNDGIEDPTIIENRYKLMESFEHQDVAHVLAACKNEFYPADKKFVPLFEVIKNLINDIQNSN